MANDWIVRKARVSEVPLLMEIERRAGVRFDAIPELARLPEVLTAADDFVEALELGLLWVAAAVPDDHAIGFAYADPFDGALHLEELDVLPDWGRRGIGQALVAAVVEEARVRGLPAVTLTTFRDVAWNAPFYTRLGFVVIDPSELSSGMATLMADEERRGLPRVLRVAMRHAIAR